MPLVRGLSVRLEAIALIAVVGGCSLISDIVPSPPIVAGGGRVAAVGDAPLVGTILGSDGKPASGVEVRVYLPDSNPLGEAAPLTDIIPLIGNAGVSLAGNSGAGLAGNSGSGFRILAASTAKSDASGNFAISPPGDGKFNLEAVKSDDFKVFKAAVSVDKKKRLDVGTLTLAPTGTLTGRVTAPNSPLVQDFEGADVFIPGTDYVAKASRSGLYTIRNVAVGAFDLTARYGSVGRARVENVSVRPKEATTVPDLELAVSPPLVEQAIPPNAGPKASVFLIGKNFGAVTGETLEVTFGGARLESVERLVNGGIRVRLPQTASNGNFQIIVQGIPSQPFPFRILGAVKIEAFDEALKLGESRHYTASATDTDGEVVDRPGVFWQQEGGTLTASATGDVTGKALGMSSLYAFSGTVGDERHITVVDRYPTVSTLAGSGAKGAVDGSAAAASFDYPQGLAIDAQGNVLVCDTGNHRIRKIAPDGTVSTFAGGTSGDADGPAADARFNGPKRLAAAPDGSIWVADTGNRKLRRIASGSVSTVAGGKDFAAVAIDAAGTVYAIDKGRNEILRMVLADSFSVLAAAADLTIQNPTGGAAWTSTPTGLAVGKSGALYLADPNASRIWKIGGGTPSVLAGSFDPVRLVNFGLLDGTASVQFSGPLDLAVDADENVYVADTLNHRIRKISPGGFVTTIAGSGKPERGNGGYADGTAVSAKFDEPAGMAAGLDGVLYASDGNNRRIRRIGP